MSNIVSRQLNALTNVPELRTECGNPVASIVIDAGCLEFVIENLPQGDGFTDDLIKLRDAAKEAMWTKAASYD